MTYHTPYTARNLLFHLLEEEKNKKSQRGGSPLLTVTVDELTSIVSSMLAEGLRPASLADYLSARPPGPEAFTLSFDDAHPSVLELAAPTLAELDLPATVFVPTEHVGETHRVMSWNELRELSKTPGWTVGSHNASHARLSWRLYDESEEAQKARLLEEAHSSRLRLEERLGLPIELFAYPFGEAPAVAREAVAEAGYRAAFTVSDSQEWDGDFRGIPRLDGNSLLSNRSDDSADPVEISVIVPACDRVAILAEVLHRLSDQSYPEDRYEVIVVDDGSSANLPRELGALLNDRIRILELEGADGTFRAGQARQAGARAARFEALLFLDADVAVDRDFLWHVAYCHGLDSRAVVLGYLSGYNLHDLGHRHRLADIAGAERLTGDVLPVIPDRGREPALRECLDDIHGLAEPWRLLYTGNVSLSRSLLDEAGGFSDDFRGWGFEDVDLGVRLHEAGALWICSRWALGYHLSDDVEALEGGAPRNPFRDPSPKAERFAPALQNLETLERRHPHHDGVAAFCAQVRSDAEEICHPPATVGVEVGAPSPVDWPFAKRVHLPWPGGLPLEEILERLDYAAKLGASSLYLLGGDVALRPELLDILARARQIADEITLETTSIPFASDGALARRAAHRGLTGAVIEVLAGCGHPRRSDEVARGVEALRAADIRVSAKLVLGRDDRGAFARAVDWIQALALPLESVVTLTPTAAEWLAEKLGHDVEVEVWEAASS